MKAIRGATTISADTPAEIKDAVGELLIQMREQNGLTDENMICILFSNTSDIKSAYPAKAAREAGFYSCALFSSLEPEIERALPLCIRVMILAEIENPVPVYLRGAANLRKDLKKFAIALDGPSGSGKSTVAKMLARKLNILYLDTGAMYRACALKAIGENVERFTEDAVAPLIENIALDIQYTDGTQRTILDGEDVSEKIRRPEVSMAASAISALPCVRIKMVEMQREIARKMSCVLDGRDIGTHVLPDAPFKFFVTASSRVCAKRRYDELRQKGYDVEYDNVLQEIEERDYNDSHRAFSPLRQAEDAVVVNTDEMNAQEVLDFIVRKIQEKV